jgi:uncharacterized protein
MLLSDKWDKGTNSGTGEINLMNGNKALFIGVVVVIAVLLSGTFYVALGSANVNSTDSSTQTGTTGAVVNTNSTARIVVSGTGTVTYIPDEAIVTIGVITENVTVAAASSANAALATGIVKSLNGLGISNNSIQTQQFSISPNYNYNGNDNDNPQMIVGYTVTDTLAVNVTAGGCSGCSILTLGERASQVIDAATAAGANQVSFGFALSNQLAQQLEKQALQQAVADASTQASTIAGAMGVSITGVIQATDTGESLQQSSNGFATAGVQSSVSSTPILPGTSTISQSVEIVYGIS